MAPLSSDAQPSTTQQLARECDELIAQAVRRPYGWAWAEGTPEAKPRGGGQAVTLDPPGTAAAAFVLYWAGDLLDQPKYKQAAYQAARGIVAAQRPTGQVPARPIFLPNAAGGRDEPALVADRAPTRAALGPWLCLLDDSGGKDELLKRGSSRAITWLLKQQSSVGAWPQGYPPTTAPKDAVRLTRLDTPDYRDSVLAMLLAYDVQQDAVQRKSIERSINVLLRMRIGEASKLGGSLWATAYGLDIFPSNRIEDYPPGVDLLASRNVMQALLGAYLVLGDPPIIGQPVKGEDKMPEAVSWSKPLFAAANAMGDLPKFDGKWKRIYDYDVASTVSPPSTAPALFVTSPPVTPPAERSGRWGMDSVLESVAGLRAVGREKFTKELSASLPIHQRLAATLCGLNDDPFATDATAALKSLDGAPAVELTDRVRRVWLLVLRARLERKIRNPQVDADEQFSLRSS